MLRKDYKLLPHVRQDLYGFNAQSMQMYPWAIKQFDVEKAWRFSEGEQVNVAVIDTGCDLTHEDLKECLLPGKNFIDHNSEPQDDNGHGTHVAGTIAAINNGIGMVGVAPKAKILPVKSLAGNGAGSHVSIADGVRWSVDNGAELITMSLGSPMPSKTLERAINYAINNNVVANNLFILVHTVFIITINTFLSHICCFLDIRSTHKARTAISPISSTHMTII